MLWHQSGVNPNGVPFVQLIMDDKVIGQMTPEEARDHARAITEAAEAAEQDSFLLHFAKSKLGCDVQQAMGLILEFRHYREDHGKKGPPSDPSEFVVDKKDKP